MNKDQQIEAIENILYSDINLSPMTKQALESIVETLKRIDAEKIQKLLSYQHELCSKRISQQIVNYLRGE